MKLTMNDLTVNPENMDQDTILSSWNWLCEEIMMPVLLTVTGNMFMQSDSGSIHFINAQGGFIEHVANSGEEFQNLLSDIEFVTDYFEPGNVKVLISEGLKLSDGQCYSLKKPLVLGGKIEVENFETADFNVYFDLMGKIHKQVKDLPEGTPISEINISE